MGGSIAKKIEKDETGQILSESSLFDLVQEADLIVLAVPLSVIVEKATEIHELASRRNKPLVVLDLGSVKGPVQKSFEELSNDWIELVASHPMAGKEHSGFEHSDAQLFQDAPWIITPHQKNHEATLHHVEQWIRSLGADPVRMSAEQHDRRVALISHMPHVLSKALLEYVKQADPESIEVSGPGFQSMTRLAHDNPSLHEEIKGLNGDNIQESLDELIDVLSAMDDSSEKLESSATGSIHDQILALKKKGEKIFDFSAGDIDLLNHPVIAESVVEAVKEGKSPYSPVAGITELRDEAANWMNTRHHSQFKRENTMVSYGGKFAVFAALKTLLKKGDEVLIAAPYWVSFPQIVSLVRGRPSIVQTTKENNWKLTADDLKKHITARTKVLILNSPNNPTGEIYSESELKEILAIAEMHDLMILSDEAYSSLVFDGPFTSCSSFQRHKDRVIVVEGCSKNFAMSGWRVGFAFGPEEVIKKMIALQSQTTTGTSYFSQIAALSVLKEHEVVSQYVREEMKRKRDLFVTQYNALFEKKIEAAPAAIYAFIETDDSAAFCKRALDESNVGLVPGDAFGMKGFIRFCFAKDNEVIVEGLKVLSNQNIDIDCRE